MKKTRFKGKKLLILSLVLVVTLLAVGFTMSTFAAGSSNDYWTFTSDSVKDPMYISNHFTSLPRAFEAEVNMPETLSGTSPIIANWTQSDTRDAFGFQISASGTPTVYYFENHYDLSGEKPATVTTKYRADFTYKIPRNQWVRIAVVNEIATGSDIYKLYVNGKHEETIDLTTTTGVADFDAVYSQNAMRELSIGNDGKYYFKGKLRNVAVYENALTEAEAAKTAKENYNAGDTNLLAYYDATMSGNDDKFFKDQTGNGHHAASAFFERSKELNQYKYSFAFIGDTQFLVKKDATEGVDTYAGPIYDWIVANKTNKNIQRVFGLGDITDKNNSLKDSAGNVIDEWSHALELHQRLQEAGIRYSIIPGNHDDYVSHANKYNSTFGKVEWFTETMDGTFSMEGTGIENYYSKFDVGEHKYMVVALEYGAEDDVLAWANQVVAANSDRRVIVITHSLYNAAGEWAQPDTSAQTTTSRTYLNNGIDIWNEFISQHSNIIIAAAGHISADVIKAGKSIGVNGNVVNTFLINPQGFDMATGYDTGMVAMFYFSEDGNNVQVEYVSTSKSMRENKDILYHERNQFSFNVNEVGDSYTYTKYGAIPNADVIGNNFAVFSGGKFVSAHSTWNAATTAVANLFSENRNADVQLLFLNDYTNNNDAFATKAASYANGKLTIDLDGHTYVRGSSGHFLSLNVGTAINEVATSNIVIKNGYMRTNGGCLVANSIDAYSYKAEKVWNLTFEDVTFGYATLAAKKGLIYQAWTNNATNDESQLGTKTNMTFNNCTFDLKTNVDKITGSNTKHTLFKLDDDHAGVDKIDVAVKINGGKILSDISHLSNVTLYTVNEGSDSFVFGEYNGEYTKLETHTTAKDYAHYTGAFPAADGDRYFVEISDNGTESVYELRKITVKNKNIDYTVDVNTYVKYLSAVDYAFFTFDKDGKLTGAFPALYTYVTKEGTEDVTKDGAMDKVIGDLSANGGMAYIVLRRDYTFSSSEVCSDLASLNGSVVIDLDGNSLIADSSTGGTNYMFDSDANVSGTASSFTIRNGSIKTYNTAVLRFRNNDRSAVMKTMNWTFEDIIFGLVSGSSYDRFFHIANGIGSGSNKANLGLTFTDCIFDLESVKPSGDFYVFRTNFTSGTYIKATIQINGGKILASDLTKVYFDNFDPANGSTMTLGKGTDDEYIKIIIPSDKDFVIKTKIGNATTDDAIGKDIKKKIENGADVSFTLFGTEGSKKIYGIGVDCDYGAVPPEYSDTATYPIFVFDKDGNFHGGFNTLLGTGGAMDAAINKVLGAETNTFDEKTGKYSGIAYIVLRTNYTIGANEKYAGSLEEARGTVVIDIGENNTLSEGSGRAKNSYLFDSKVTSAIEYGSYFIFKNGYINTYKNALIRFQAYNSSADVSKNLMSWTFDNVTLGLVDGSAYTRFFHVSDTNSTGAVAPVELNFNDCTFDLKTVTSTAPFYIFRTNFIDSTNIKADIRVNGGKILANDPSNKTNGIFLDNFSDQEGSTMYYGPGSDGEYLKIVLPKGQTFGIYASTYEGKTEVIKLYDLSNNITRQTVNGTNIKFYKESSSDEGDVYAFCFDTKYGTVPAKYEDKQAYPFLLFDANGVFKKATDRWALDNTTSALSSSKSKGYVVLLRRDYTNTDSQYNNLSHTVDLTIDLNGFTLTNSSCTLFMAQKKPQDEKEQNSKITLINGTVVLGKRALVKMDTSVKTTTNTYGFTFVFEDLTVKMTGSATTDKLICQDEFAAGDPVQYCNFTFNNCVFDLSNANKAMTLFDVSDSCCKVTAVMNGGEIITSTYGVTLWKNYETEPGTVTAHAESTLTFVNDGGSYTVLKVPTGAETPIVSVNNGTLYFVRTATDGIYAVYSLSNTNFNGMFTLKSSITLSSELVYNVYVPVTTLLKSFELNGTAYTNLAALTNIVTLSDGNKYYHFAIELPVTDAADNIVLDAVVTAGGKDYNVSFTMSIPKYAQRVLNNTSSTNVEKTLVKDVLVYVKEAYNYSGFASFNDAAEIERVTTLVNSIIGEYTAELTTTGTTAKDSGGIVTEVALNLEAKPTIRFYVTNTNITFKSGDKVLGVVKGNGYVELDVYAYALCETITFGNGGSYHISDYVAKASGESYEALAKAFVKYTESAAAYRNQELAKNS